MIYYGLLLVFVFEYLRPGSYFPPLGKLYSLLPAAVFFFSLFLKNKISNIDILKYGNTRWLIFFIFLILVSIASADVTLYAYKVFKMVFGYFILVFIINKVVDDFSKIKGVFATLVFVHVAIIVLNPEVVLDPSTRSYLANAAFLGDGNDFALSICIVIPFCVFLFLEERSKLRKFLYLVTLMMLILSVVGTASRGGTIALIFILFYLWMKSKRRALGLVLLALVVMTALLYASPLYFQRMGTLKNYHKEGSAQGRIMAWKSGVRMALDHPLLGVGAGHFAVKYGVEYRPPGFGPTDLPWSNAHSIYFKLLGELGFPGIIFLFSVIFLNYAGNKKRLNELQKNKTDQFISYQRLFICLNASFMGFLVAGAFLSGIYYPHFYVLLGLMNSGRFIYEKRFKSSIADYNGVGAST